MRFPGNNEIQSDEGVVSGGYADPGVTIDPVQAAIQNVLAAHGQGQPGTPGQADPMGGAQQVQTGTIPTGQALPQTQQGVDPTQSAPAAPVAQQQQPQQPVAPAQPQLDPLAAMQMLEQMGFQVSRPGAQAQQPQVPQMPPAPTGPNPQELAMLASQIAVPAELEGYPEEVQQAYVVQKAIEISTQRAQAQWQEQMDQMMRPIRTEQTMSHLAQKHAIDPAALGELLKGADPEWADVYRANPWFQKVMDDAIAHHKSKGVQAQLQAQAKPLMSAEQVGTGGNPNPNQMTAGQNYNPEKIAQAEQVLAALKNGQGRIVNV